MLRLVVREDEVAAAAVDLEPAARGRRMLIAEHSMCQPGRPAPHGDGHAGSSGSEGCQSTKSSGSRLPGISGVLPRSMASGSISSRETARQLPVCRPRVDAEVDVPVGRRRRARLASSRAISSCICGMCCVARGNWSGGSQLRAAISVRKVVTCRLPRAR